MRSVLVTYDLRGNRDYERLYAAIKAYERYARVLGSVWIVQTQRTAEHVLDDLARHVDGDDQLFVATLTGEADWKKNLSPKVLEWLENNL